MAGVRREAGSPHSPRVVMESRTENKNARSEIQYVTARRASSLGKLEDEKEVSGTCRRKGTAPRTGREQFLRAEDRHRSSAPRQGAE